MIHVAVDGVSVNTACRQRQVGYRFDHEKCKDHETEAQAQAETR